MVYVKMMGMEYLGKKDLDEALWISWFDQEGQILLWSRRAEAVSGYSRKQLDGRVWELLFPDKQYRQKIEGALNLLIKDSSTSSCLEANITGIQGNKVAMVWNVFPLEPKSGKPGWLILGHETKSSSAEHNTWFKVWMDNIPHIVYIKDDQGYYIFVNPYFSQLAARSIGQVIGKQDRHIWPQAIADVLVRNDKEVLKKNKPQYYRESMATGQVFMSIKFPLNGNNQRVLGGISIDISDQVKQEEKIKRDKQRYEQTLSLLPDILFETDREGQITFLNQAGKKVLTLGQDDIERGVLALELVAEKDREEIEHEFMSILKKQRSKSKLLEFDIQGESDVITVAGHIAPITDGVQILGVRGVVVDITLLKQKEKDLKESEEKYKRLFNHLKDGIYVSTLDGRYIDVNPALVDMLGYPNRKELLAKNIIEDIYVDRSQRPRPSQRVRPFETQLKKADGSKIWVEISCQVHMDEGKPAYYEGIVRDISIRKEYEEKLRFKSFHDGLTGLYNRAYFEEELRRLDRKRQLPLSIIMGDVNNLKLINDAFGHQQGDKLLKKTAEILAQACRKEDIIARWGGDEFAILLPKTSQQTAARIVDRINDIAGTYKQVYVPLSVSLGKATKISETQSLRPVLAEAEDNMYRQKLLDKKKVSGQVIMSLEKALLKKNYYSVSHIQTVKKAALSIGKELGLSGTKLDDLSLLAGAYQIGKISIPDNVINKKGPLNEEEWKAIKKYPEAGYNIAEAIPQISHLSEAILSHRECWDGSGYPQGLMGEAIPLYARIIAIADAYSAMVSRHYRARLSHQQAIGELRENAGIQFDPYLIKKAILALDKNN